MLKGIRHHQDTLNVRVFNQQATYIGKGIERLHEARLVQEESKFLINMFPRAPKEKTSFFGFTPCK